MTPSESYEEWLEMVREEDVRNRQAFTGERPLTVTEFIHRKQWAEPDAMEIEWKRQMDALEEQKMYNDFVLSHDGMVMINGELHAPAWFKQWLPEDDQHV